MLSLCPVDYKMLVTETALFLHWGTLDMSVPVPAMQHLSTSWLDEVWSKKHQGWL